MMMFFEISQRIILVFFQAIALDREIWVDERRRTNLMSGIGALSTTTTLMWADLKKTRVLSRMIVSWSIHFMEVTKVLGTNC